MGMGEEEKANGLERTNELLRTVVEPDLAENAVTAELMQDYAYVTLQSFCMARAKN
jgi:hypothetical protein